MIAEADCKAEIFISYEIGKLKRKSSFCEKMEILKITI